MIALQTGAAIGISTDLWVDMSIAPCCSGGQGGAENLNFALA
jgi:hypothetical protein